MTILCYPNIPSQYSVLHKIAELKKWIITNNPKDHFDVVVNWEDTTYRTHDDQLRELAERVHVVNLGCADISKQRVDRIHNEVFGYGVVVDPLTYKGPIVQKADKNAAHDGSIIDGPISLKERDEAIAQGMMFSCLLNNEAGEFVQDIRVPIFSAEIPFCYLKYRPIATRFSNANSHVELRDKTDALSEEELELIVLFCKKAGFFPAQWDPKLGIHVT